MSPPIKYVPDDIELQFNELLISSTKQPSIDAAFYPSDKELCRLAYLVYKSHEDLESILANDKDLDGWTLLATGKSESFFRTYYRGAAFWHQGNRQLVISHRGTNSGGDVLTDIKGCILNQYTIPLDMACTFAVLVLEKTKNIHNCSISITGHSLGAWLAQISAFSIECLTVKDKDGTTVLHFACRDGREDIALMLIRKGADPIATDSYGISPLDLANRNEHNHLVEEILNLDKEDE